MASEDILNYFHIVLRTCYIYLHYENYVTTIDIMFVMEYGSYIDQRK